VIDVIETKFQRNYPGYVYKRELVSDSSCNELFEMVSCYSPLDGSYIGNTKIARYLCKKIGIREIQAANGHQVATIGFNHIEQKWYGWSHRAICGFGIGDKVFIEDFGDDETLFTEHGTETIEDLGQAKQAAINFAAYVG